MRQRLSWEKKADPYTMNQTRQNPPVEKYQTGDPDAWAETPHMDAPWKSEGRTETGHPAPAREAVVAMKKMEDKALKCITIAQRMLPGASDQQIEDQATELMHMPEKSVLATLDRQIAVAQKLAAEKKDEEYDEDEKKPEEGVEAAKKDEKEEVPVVPAAPAAPAAPAPAAPVEEKKAEVAPVVPPVEEKKPEEKKPEEEETKEAGDLLDQIFAEQMEEVAPTPKTGAKKLSGLVKQASTGDDPLSNLWEGAPDVSKVFHK